MRKCLSSFMMILGIICSAQKMQSFSEDNLAKIFPDLKKLNGYIGLNIYYSEAAVEIVPQNSDQYIDKKYILKLKTESGLYIGLGTAVAGLGNIKLINENDNSEIKTNGISLIVTSNKIIYADFRSFFNPPIVEKIQIMNGKYVVIKQPFYSIERTDVAQSDFNILYESSNKSNIVARIGKGTEITIVGLKTTNYFDKTAERWVLVRSGMGLLGWVRPFYIDDADPTSVHGFLHLFNDNTP
jgi:hypothetical protein